MSPIAVYVHIPFCPSKCGYCDFNSFAQSGEIIDRTVEATKSQILSSPLAGRPAKTVFFGGGTPTFVQAEQLATLLEAVREVHPFDEGIEITSEANPGTADAEKFAAMRKAGFNRISLGAQSFNQSDLIQLGRVHHASDVPHAVGLARRAGFENLNLDLMFALPGQSERGWKANLETALSLNPDHLSLYCLTIEPNTRFHRYAHRGMLDLPDEDAQVRMYEFACDVTSAAGFQQYEISNFAKPGRESQHNLCYWRGEEYAGYGPGAVGRVGMERYVTTKSPERFCEEVGSGIRPWCDQETLTEAELALERVMLGLRLNEGLDLGVSHDARGLERIVENGWAEVEGGRVKLTAKGRHFCSEAVAYLAP